MSADMITSFTTAFTGVQTSVTSLLAVAVPIAVGIGATLFVVRRGFRWFTSIIH